VPIDGASGVVYGVTELEALLAKLVPTELVAVTVKVYAVPLVSPVTLIGLEAPEAIIPPGLEVIVYEVIVAPPSSPGAEKVTLAVPLTPETDAVPIEGTPGTVGPLEGVTAFEALLAELVPAALVAVTVKVYSVPFDNPLTVTGLAAPDAVILPGLEVTV